MANLRFLEGINMSEWKEYKLKDITYKITSGGTPKSAEASYYDGDIPWLNTKEINFNRIGKTERYITEDGLNNSSAKWIPKDSVIIAMYGTTAAKVAYSLIDLTTNQACCNLIINKDIADSKFVYYYIQSSYEDLFNLACGAAQQNLSVGVIAEFPILLPPLEEQKRIASILSSLDDKIDLLHRENTTLEAMAETLFRQWFIEEAKEDWEEVLLDFIAFLNAGGDKPKRVSQSCTEDCNVPIYSNGIENEGLYGYTDIPKIVDESVTISARGTIGYVVLRTEPFVPIVRLITLIPKECVTSKYLYYLLKNQNIEGTGTTQQQLTVPDFKQMKVLLPEKVLIDRFTNEVNVYYDKILENKKNIGVIIQMRDKLLKYLY